MYRVYDYEKKKFINDKIYLSPHPNSELYILKKNFIGRDKLIIASPERFICQKDINLFDKNNKLIFEGDIVEANVSEDRIVTGMIVYAHEFSAYIILCYDTNEYFTLGESVCKYVEVIGNVMENKELMPINSIEREELDGNEAL